MRSNKKRKRAKRTSREKVTDELVPVHPAKSQGSVTRREEYIKRIRESCVLVEEQSSEKDYRFLKRQLNTRRRSLARQVILAYYKRAENAKQQQKIETTTTASSVVKKATSISLFIPPISNAVILGSGKRINYSSRRETIHVRMCSQCGRPSMPNDNVCKQCSSD